MHLGIAVLWVRLFFLATTCLFGAGLIAYISCGWRCPWVIQSSRRTLSQASVRHGRHRFPEATCRTEHILFPWNINLLQLRKMVSTRNHHLLKIRLHATTERMAIRNLPAKVLSRTLKKAPKPALLALAGLMLLSICFVMFAGGVERTLIVPLLLGLVGIGVSWLRFNAEEGQLWTMLGGIAIFFAAYALYVSSCMHFDAFSMIRILCAGLALLIGVLLAIVHGSWR